MTVSAAKNNSVLRKRILRYFSNENENKRNIVEFLNNISKCGDPLLFGGAIRDINLYGIKHFKSDLDFVFDGTSECLERSISKYKTHKNKFGGYRLCIDSIDIDIWPIEKTWAFKNKAVKYKDRNSLLATTITNWDSIYFSWNEKKLHHSKKYFEDILDGYLDIVLDKNPNPLGLLVRVLRSCILKESHKLSRHLSNTVYKELCNYTVDEIITTEKLSYEKTYITESIIRYLKLILSNNHNKTFPIEIDKFNKTKSLLSDM